MKKLTFFLFLLSCFTAMAQDKFGPATHQFSISGKIKNPSVITMDSLAKYSIVPIGGMAVTDHTGALKHKDADLKGILLKDILIHTEIDAAGPHFYSGFYFTCVGSDGYKVVYSWNELFNTEIGDHVYIIMEKNGVTAGKLPESIQMASMMDQKTGRRYLHNLDKIIISEAAAN
jgi:hypothetical protein